MSEQTAQHGERFDVVVIGGGAAGLSGALTLARARRSVVVVDDGRPRNAPADGVHGYLGREGVAPAELLDTGRAEVRGYGGQFRQGTVLAVEQESAGAAEDGDVPGFAVRLTGGGVLRARRLLVATGLVDELPDVAGLAGLWGSDVLHCPYCHGWEVRDQAIGVLNTGPLAVHQALLWRQWSEDVTLFLHTGPEPDDEEYEQLAARGIAVVDGEVSALEREDGRLTGVRLAGGTVVGCRALAVASRMTARAGFLASLGLEPVELEKAGAVLGSQIPADPTGLTAVPGVWIAGNLASMTEQVAGSAAAGVRAAGALNADLITEDTRRAVAARRNVAARAGAPRNVATGIGADPSPFGPAGMEREVSERVLGTRRHGM
ncbi:NAD(P)/FAD-dependent oxidoreductase [Streptomyces armeniacus]|uniref:NAD(P)/FAD-dependent oxidoreductase n=1 Tax=Streptomyces armeniacus TaxID=83291 RepID=A0A345XIG9_9ACTN|nr:NAD(P)/FAD-dependent oxidoreductase [Streptomyces armeniacus]AXK31435.1 NAD(P)/FAD-dependent oxidoreductase [Streptomyces armeniacus]